MSKSSKHFLFIGSFLVILIGYGFVFGFSSALESKSQKMESGVNLTVGLEELATIQENSLLPISSIPEPKMARKLMVVVTAYSSTVWETDDDPYLTAAGTMVRNGIVANNILAFGTKIRIPELYGEKIFVVEDRMSWKKGNYQIDIWFPSYSEALNFGAKRTYIEILKN